MRTVPLQRFVVAAVVGALPAFAQDSRPASTGKGAARASAPELPAGDEGEEEIDKAPPPPPPPKLTRTPTILRDGMVRIPGGRFTMGSDDAKSPANERPARQVVVGPFWIDRTEVTVAAYRACVEHQHCPRPARSSTLCTYDAGDGALPVSCVPWSSAAAFCALAGKRLPREVEWELAARGTTPLKYPWGGSSAAGCGPAVTLAGDATQRSCGGKHPARVGSHLGGASPFGVLDMSGNVEEWVADWYGESPSDLSPRAGASHVLRGGGWLSQPSAARTTSRNWGSAHEMGPNVGFRCARDD